MPDAEELAEARALVGYKNIKLDERAHTVQLLKPGMRLDLGGIAKGYSADEALQVLKQHGITSALVVEIAVFLTTNYTVRRPRPPIEHLGSTPSTFSFPSGHVAATVVLYGGIAVLARQRRVHPVWQVTAWVVAVILTVAVAWSRVYRGQHHATGDVIVVRYADDIVAGFEYRTDAERFLEEWKERLR